MVDTSRMPCRNNGLVAGRKTLIEDWLAGGLRDRAGSKRTYGISRKSMHKRVQRFQAAWAGGPSESDAQAPDRAGRVPAEMEQRLERPPKPPARRLMCKQSGRSNGPERSIRKACCHNQVSWKFGPSGDMGSLPDDRSAHWQRTWSSIGRTSLTRESHVSGRSSVTRIRQPLRRTCSSRQRLRHCSRSARTQEGRVGEFGWRPRHANHVLARLEPKVCIKRRAPVCPTRSCGLYQGAAPQRVPPSDRQMSFQT